MPTVQKIDSAKITADKIWINQAYEHYLSMLGLRSKLISALTTDKDSSYYKESVKFGSRVSEFVSTLSKKDILHTLKERYPEELL